MGVGIALVMVFSFGAGLLVWWKWLEGFLYKAIVSGRDKETCSIDALTSKYGKRVGLIALVISIILLVFTFFVGALGFVLGPFALAWFCTGINNIWKDRQ